MSSIDCSSFNLFIMFCVIYTYTYVMYKVGWFPVYNWNNFIILFSCIELYIRIIYNFRFWRKTTIFFPNQKNSTFTIDTPIELTEHNKHNIILITWCPNSQKNWNNSNEKRKIPSGVGKVWLTQGALQSPAVLKGWKAGTQRNVILDF